MSATDSPKLPGSEPSVLVGRERERIVLRQQLKAAFAGQGSLVLIGGEAGIGKTALAEAVCQDAEAQGALVLVGRCYDLTETPPYGPWIELFARYRPTDGDPSLPAAFTERGTVGAVASQSLLFRQVEDFLAALATSRPEGTRPVALLLDDLHWADPASLVLLRSLARALATLPLLLVATYRSDELTRRHPLSQLLPMLVRESRAERLDLRPLGERDLRELIAARYPVGAADTSRLIVYLHGRAEGNPLFVGELLRTLEEGGILRATDGGWALGDLTRLRVPPLLRQVIDGRLARLGEESQALLGVAAVVGQEVPLALWSAATDTGEEALLPVVERAVEAHLLIETPEGMRVHFAHALIREALYEGVSPARRRLLHRRIAELIAERPHPDPDVVAMHFQRASDRRAVEWLVWAGERAQLAYARLTAIERYEGALALVEGDEDPVQRGWLRYRIARLRRYSTPQRSIEYLDEALRIADAIGDRALAAAARYSRGQCRLYESDDHNDAAVLAEMVAGCDALEALSPNDQGRLGLGPDEDGLPTITNARGYLVLALAENGRIAEALALGEATRDGKPRHTPLGDVAWQSYGYREAGLSTAYALAGRPTEARAAWERAHACYRDLGNYTTGNTLLIALLLVWLPYYADQPDDLKRLADASEDAYRRRVLATYDRLAHLPLLALAGRWVEAREGAETALQRTWGQRAFRGVAAAVLSDLDRAQGKPDAAWTVIRDAMPAGPQTPVGALIWFIGPPLLRGAADLALDAGDLPTAKEWLDAHDHWLASSGAVLGASEGQALWSRYHRTVGDAAQAYRCAERALAHATEPRQPLALLIAHRLLGELDTDSGAHKEADRHLKASLALADACEVPYERALTLLAMAELGRATDDRDAARALLGEVKIICEPLDAQPALTRVNILSEHLDTAPPVAVTYPAGLSAREVEVLRLVAEGLSNPQVGARLFLSPRTVEQHLRSVFIKTGVTSRVAAARWAADHALV